MRTYTLRETAEQGITLRAEAQVGQHKAGRPGVWIGSGEGRVVLPCSDRINDEFDAGVQVDAIKKNSAGVYEVLLNANLDVHKKGKLQHTETTQSCCLIHIETIAGVGGTLEYSAASYDEVFNISYVERVYHAFPPPGITVLAEGKGQNNEPQLLLKMASGSHFRILRNGTLDDRTDPTLLIPPVLYVSWRNNHLRVDYPMRFKKARRAA